MRLLRVQVPEFRALKDVDISFEPDFNPQVFPLGSLNGGGKSTLLQLIFVLLSHFGNSNITFSLQNIFSEMKSYNVRMLESLAEITLLINNEEIVIEYLFYYDSTGRNIIPDFDTGKDNKICYFQEKIENFFVFSTITFTEKFYFDNDNFIEIDIKKYQTAIAQRIYFISPSNQPYIFLERETRRALFTDTKRHSYYEWMLNIQKLLPNFFTFDFVDVLVEVFRMARANDFKERNKDNPFAHTEKLEADINNLFIDGKKIASLIIEQQRHTEDEIQGVFFKLPSGEEIYPEDLSHGELKRLTIFVLIKYHEMQDSIVLIDEIENGFHPDWQYQIVRDLVEWGKNNQYILATHSYELCNAVTPAHVKILEPRLIK